MVIVGLLAQINFHSCLCSTAAWELVQRARGEWFESRSGHTFDLGQILDASSSAAQRKGFSQYARCVVSFLARSTPALLMPSWRLSSNDRKPSLLFFAGEAPCLRSEVQDDIVEEKGYHLGENLAKT